MTTRILDDVLSIQIKGKWINIGKINTSRVLTVFRDRSKHLMKKYNSYGFNKDVLSMDIFDFIILEEKVEGHKNVYIIERKWLETHSETDTSPGFDTQLFVELSQIQQFKHDPR